MVSPELGPFAPPLLSIVRQAVLAAEGKRISIFVGLHDEGLAIPCGSFIPQGGEERVEIFECFNRTQDFRLPAG